MTSTALMSSEASSRKSAWRWLAPGPPALITLMPLISTRFSAGSTPRIEIATPSPKSRDNCTPVTRDSASPMFLSGNCAMSSATIESATVPGARLRSMPDFRLARVPTTMMDSTSSELEAGFSAGCSAVCAQAVFAATLMASAARDVEMEWKWPNFR